MDPWTGLAAVGGKRVNELFLDGTTPQQDLPADQRCGEAVLSSRGLRGRAQVVDGGQPGLDGAGGAGRRGARRAREHADGLLLQPGLQPVRPILGPAHGRRRGMRPTVAEPVDRPLRIAGSVRVGRPAGVRGPARVTRDLPVAVRRSAEPSVEPSPWSRPSRPSRRHGPRRSRRPRRRRSRHRRPRRSRRPSPRPSRPPRRADAGRRRRRPSGPRRSRPRDRQARSRSGPGPRPSPGPGRTPRAAPG